LIHASKRVFLNFSSAICIKKNEKTLSQTETLAKQFSKTQGKIQNVVRDNMQEINTFISLVADSQCKTDAAFFIIISCHNQAMCFLIPTFTKIKHGKSALYKCAWFHHKEIL